MIKLVKSSFYNEQRTKLRLADFIINAKIFSMGEECKKFEIAFAKKYERKYAVFVSNGSAANLVLIQALLNVGKLKIGDKVGFSALTWATNVMPLIQLGLIPVPIDCELDTLNVSPKLLEEKIKDIKGLFLTNVLGFSDDIKTIKKICTENKVLFFEDNCESLGSRVDKTLLGNFGIAGTFSFFIGHHLSTIEGGMIVTDDQELYEMLIMTRAHGWDRNLDSEAQNKYRKAANVNDFYAKYSFYDLAYNTRPTEINGFIGNIQMEVWDEILIKREINFQKFLQAINSNPNYYHYDFSHMSFISNMAMPVVCKTKESYDKLIAKYLQNDIEIRPLIAGDITQQPFYKKYYKIDENLVNADIVTKQGLYFPNNPELTEDEVSLLAGILK